MLLFVSVPLVVGLTAISEWPWLLPISSGGAAWAWLRTRRGSSTLRTTGVLLLWASLLSLSIVLLTILCPERAASSISHSTVYWHEMSEYLRSGAGKEGTPSRFIPEHLVHLFAFVVLALGTGGLAALILGAYLLGYMSYYVGQVALHAEHPLIAGALAWHPWALLRIIAFVLMGVVLARPLLERRSPLAIMRIEKKALGFALGLWGADLILKAAIAPAWSSIIRSWGGLLLEH